MLKNISFITVLLMSTVMQLFAQEIPTPEQMILLLKASSERYKTFDAKIDVNAFRPGSNSDKPELVYSKNILWRSTSDKSYFKIDSSNYEQVEYSDSPVKTITTYLITPQWSKRLLESGDRTPLGQIEPGRLLEYDHGLDMVKDAMCDFFKWPLEKADLEASSVIFDRKTNNYILTLKMGTPDKGPTIKLFIDSSKGWFPVKKQLLKHDGSLVMNFESRNFKQIKAGLWIPLNYIWGNPQDNFTMTYEVREIKVNEPLSDELFELSFPSGTIIKDNIAGLKYIVNDSDMARSGIDDLLGDKTVSKYTNSNTSEKDDKMLLKKEDIREAEHAKEKELIEAATEAHKLLSLPNHSKTRYIYYVILIIALFIFASVVLFKMVNR